MSTPPFSTPGRKSKTGRRYYESPLYPLLEKGFPKCKERGRLSISMVAEVLGCTPQWVYEWLLRDRLSPKVALLLVEKATDTAGRERIKLKDLTPYVFAAPRK